VWFQQAFGKLSRNTAEVFDSTTQLWVPLGFRVQLPTSGRWIGRTESFFARRFLLSPSLLPTGAQVIRFTSSPEQYLIYGMQPNIEADKGYAYEYTLLSVEVGYAELFNLVPQIKASGVSGEKVEASLGLFPFATDRYAGVAGTYTRDVTQSKLNGYIPTYSAIRPEHILRWTSPEGRAYEYDIKEVYPELSLYHVTLVQR